MILWFFVIIFGWVFGFIFCCGNLGGIFCSEWFICCFGDWSYSWKYRLLRWLRCRSMYKVFFFCCFWNWYWIWYLDIIGIVWSFGRILWRRRFIEYGKRVYCNGVSRIICGDLFWWFYWIIRVRYVDNMNISVSIYLVGYFNGDRFLFGSRIWFDYVFSIFFWFFCLNDFKVIFNYINDFWLCSRFCFCF